MEDNYALPEVDDDWLSRQVFENEIRELDKTSTPGWPYMKEKPTIGQWLNWDPVHLVADPMQLERLWYDMNLFISGHYEHQFRVFVKDEPHKQSKIEQKRWRLIMCASLPVQMAWRLALRHQNDWLNNHPYECPSAHGLVFCYGGWRRFRAHAKSQRLQYSRDISAWDLNAPGWIFRVIREFRKRAGGPRAWLDLVDRLYDDAFVHPKLRFSNGLVLRQDFEGVMKSGLFVTIADNSLGMGGTHVLASLRSGTPIGNLWATGDDVLQSHISDRYLDELLRAGCRVKEWEPRLVFMGTDFTSYPTPMYFQKHVVNFWVSSDNLEERLDAYARLWCHHDDIFQFWRVLAKISGVTLRSKNYYQFWYDSPMAKILNKMTWLVARSH